MFRGAPPADAPAATAQSSPHTISSDSRPTLTLIEMKSEYWIGVLGDV